MKTKIALGIVLLSAASARAQAPVPPQGGAARAAAVQAPNAAGATLESINAEFQKGVTALERARLQQIGRLAASQPKDQATATYSTFFSLAISGGLYAEAEPVAEALIKSRETSPEVAWLAHLVNMVAEADRGQFDESLRSLSAAIRLKGKEAKAGEDAPALPIPTRAAILDAYYQRLAREDQFDVARRAMTMIAEATDVPAIRELAQGRLKQLDRIGKPAPAIRGIDVDRKPFALEPGKGEVVLVVFWASWCVPNAQEMPWLEAVHRRYAGQGLRIVGVNLDAPAGAAQDASIPNVRRFLLDFNVPWTNLLNGQGDSDLAGAFGVREIPANVLIGRDGKVSHLDLKGARLDRAVASEIKKAK